MIALKKQEEKGQDNAPVHKSLVSLNSIHDAGFKLIAHPSYSPDLALGDFFVFSNLRERLWGTKQQQQK